MTSEPLHRSDDSRSSHLSPSLSGFPSQDEMRFDDGEQSALLRWIEDAASSISDAETDVRRPLYVITNCIR